MKKMDFDTVMHEITDGLTGDSAKDIPYLMGKSGEYKDSEYAVEIARACGRLVYSMMPDDKKATLNQMAGNHSLGIRSVVDEAQFNMYRGKFDIAKKILIAAVHKIEQLNMFQDDAVSEYHTFNSPIEEILYTHLYEPQKKLRQAPEPLSILYLSLGSVHVEYGEMDDAKATLENAMRWNPIDPMIAFEYAEIAKKKGDMGNFYATTIKTFKHAYRSQYLARCYRNLGYYFVEKKLWKVAAGCYTLSMQYESDGKQAQSELWYIQQNAPDDFSMPSVDEIKEYAEKYHFPIGPDKDVMGISLSFGKEALDASEWEVAKYFFGIAYDLTGDERIKSILDEIPEPDSNA